jgi:hypothetical protein
MRPLAARSSAYVHALIAWLGAAIKRCSRRASARRRHRVFELPTGIRRMIFAQVQGVIAEYERAKILSAVVAVVATLRAPVLSAHTGAF